MSAPALRNLIRQRVEGQGWISGSDLEDRAAFRMAKWGLGPKITKQQYRFGKYRLDFAWPEIRVALEVDGFHHARPETAAKDAERDRWLRSQGWLTFRVEDVPTDDAFQELLLRPVLLIKAMLRDERLLPCWERKP